jgi:hypothetical protein
MVHIPCSEVPVPRFLIAFFPGESERVEPHGFCCAAFIIGFKCWLFQIFAIFSLMSSTGSPDIHVTD